MINGYPLAGAVLAVVCVINLWRAGKNRKTPGIIARLIQWLLPAVLAAGAAWYFLNGNAGWAELAAGGVIVARNVAWVWTRFKNKDGSDTVDVEGLPRAARTAGFLTLIAGLFTVAAFVPFQDLLGAWVSMKWGIGALAACDLALAGAVYWEWWHRHGYHQAWTTVTCFLGGVCAVTTYAAWDRILRQGTKILPNTGSALAQAEQRISTGKAAKAAQSIPGINHAHLVAIGGFAFIALVLFVSIGGHHAARKANKKVKAAARTRNARAVGAAPGRKAIGG